jgi:hypothetical protein
MGIVIQPDWKVLDLLAIARPTPGNDPQFSALPGMMAIALQFVLNSSIGCDSIKLPHDYEEGTDLVPYLNWARPATSSAGTWSLFHSGWLDSISGSALYAEATTTEPAPLVAFDNLAVHSLVFGSSIPGTGRKIGSILNLTLQLSALGGSGNSSIYLVGFGLFYKASTIGSQAMTTKEV